MNIKKLGQSLHVLERDVLPFLSDNITLNELVEKTKLNEVEVLRGLQWLQNKNALKILTKKSEFARLGKNGRLYLKTGLPEKRFLSVIEDNLSLKQVQEKAELDKDELQISLGVLKKKDAIVIGDKIKITERGKYLLKNGFPEEKFLSKLPVEFRKLNEQDKELLIVLTKRKQIVSLDVVKEIRVRLTDLGRKLVHADIFTNTLEAVDGNLLRTGGWKGKIFRRYDVNDIVPRIYYGKRHFVQEAIQYIKRIWLDLGFEEMTGNFVQTGFWNFDALFTPQDHPARELQDTFYLENPGKGKLPGNRIVGNVRKAHEKGVSGSKGWRYPWKAEDAMLNVLRTHTTVLSAQTIARLRKEELPVKFFSVGKVFRNETVDWEHAFEFEQTEGIVVGEDVNFRNLLGYLKEFFSKMGFEKIRFRPGYFPYTEFSVEPEVFHPKHKKWIELGGAGIFRPEVVVPLLGKDVPVLAWGLGVGRIIMDYYNLHDLRKLYNNDVKQMREMKVWTR